MNMGFFFFFPFYAEIQDGRQFWRENDFCEKSPVDSEDTWQVKNFIEITVSRSLSEINTFWCGKLPVDCADNLRVKNVVEISLRFGDKHIFAFYTEIQDGRQKWRENVFCKKLPVDSADTLQVKNFVEIALSGSISKIIAFLRFTQKFMMAAKSGGKMFFAKN